MTTALAPLGEIWMARLFAPSRSTAQSEFARKLDEMQEEVRVELLSSYVMRNPVELVLNELEEVRSEASYEGWDGYSALPLNQSACEFARRFLNTLPSATPLPEVSADTEGEVALDWIFGERKALTVSIGPTGRCTYAWMFGQGTHRGTEWIDDEIPETIVFALGQLARGSATVGVR